MDIINQLSDWNKTISFVDGSNNAVTPANNSFLYRIDDLDTGRAITSNNNNSWIAANSTNNSAVITITANQNSLLGNAPGNNAVNATDREERVITVKYSYGANNASQGTLEYRYFITRLPYLLST